MARPLRIEFPGAWYHAMNRGAGRREIFTSNGERRFFLELLADLRQMFGVETHAYCLMGNHYHLLLHTPRANLQRAMRHLNGVYTQRLNFTSRTDGPLFRGRYKAILVDADAYLLNVSRYIHLNPVVAEIVSDPASYRWSSFPAYIGEETPPDWLSMEATLNMTGHGASRSEYRSFVEMGLDQETATFYGKTKPGSILGGDDFRRRVSTTIRRDPEIPESRRSNAAVSIDTVVEVTAEALGADRDRMLRGGRGRNSRNLPRETAIYLSRRLAGRPLREIATFFGLGHYGSVSSIVNRCQKSLADDSERKRIVDEIVNNINEKT